ncbi:hypothetical protein Q6244_28575, partial [Klebsiella pneumoniae]|nr:hypothetical protein [Klebsiella pneumoniae]
GAVTIRADHPQEGTALLTYLAAPAAQETIHATGMRRVAAAAPVSQKDTGQSSASPALPPRRTEDGR